MELTIHYVGIAEQIGLDDVHVDEVGSVLAQADGQQMAIDLYPSDPGYLRVLTSADLPLPADPWQVAAEVGDRIKMVTAAVLDSGIGIAVETLADPSADEELPRADLAAAALQRAVGALLAAVGHICDAAELAGILAAGGDAPQPEWEPYPTHFAAPQDAYVACPSRGQHTDLTECWMCWADVHTGRIPLHAAIRGDQPSDPEPAVWTLFGEDSRR